MLVAVTGGTGFVGRHIVNLLIERGHRVRALVRRSGILPFAHADRGEKVVGQLGDPAALGTLVAGADVVIHLVGIIAERGAHTFDAVHVEGTRAALAAVRAAGCRRFVHMSAAGARDAPGATAYHRTKAQAEELVRASGIPAAVFRPSFIIGPGNVPVATLARLHRWLPVVPVFGDARFPLQPIAVGDTALAFALAAERSEFTGTFELGGPDVITYEEFVRAIGRASGRPRPVFHVPLPLVRAAARVFGLLGPWAPITSDQLQMLVEGSVAPENAVEPDPGFARTLGHPLTHGPFDRGAAADEFRFRVRPSLGDALQQLPPVGRRFLPGGAQEEDQDRDRRQLHLAPGNGMSRSSKVKFSYATNERTARRMAVTLGVAKLFMRFR